MTDLTCGMIRRSLISGEEKTGTERKKADEIRAQQCVGSMPSGMVGCQQNMGSMPSGMAGCQQNMGNMPSGMAGWNQTMGNRPMQTGNLPSVGGIQNPSSAQARCMLRKRIDELSFAMDDAHLFLDTHPDNAEAFQYFKNAVSMRQNAVRSYERQFGPLMVEDAVGDTWNWVTEQWPWEGGC